MELHHQYFRYFFHHITSQKIVESVKTTARINKTLKQTFTAKKSIGIKSDYSGYEYDFYLFEGWRGRGRGKLQVHTGLYFTL